MRNNKSIVGLVAVAFMVLTITAAGFSVQNANQAGALQVPEGARQKIQGVVSTRSGDSFKVRDS